MQDEIFRKKSLNKIKSPEGLNDYVRVANPGVWMVLSAVIILLVGVCIWGALGRIETKVPANLVVKNGECVCVLNDADADKIKAGMTVKTEKISGKIVSAKDNQIEVEINLPDGKYEADVITESIKPLSFVFN
ncbi:MAG: hypothetical protein MJ147_09465 [Clostridia bacterium]|nr:hypothetical protein [Clostridia bacterium]